MPSPLRRPRPYEPAALPISEAREQLPTLAENTAHGKGSITWLTRRGRQMAAVVSADVVELALWARRKQLEEAMADLHRRFEGLPADLADAEEAERALLERETGLAA